MSDFISKIEIPKTLNDQAIGSAVKKEIKAIETRLLQARKISRKSGRIKKTERSVRVIFDGPSGTGKTMAAEILSKSLGLDLYRIDLARIVSKYIGETEKNLKQIFDRAEGMNWILFFDEADALFGKRTDVKDSHDRFANNEVSYLLDRIEEYEGISILATNFIHHIDDAFRRRFHFFISFP